MDDRSCRRPSGKHLVTFVVVADTHTNQSESESASNYKSQILANARSRHVFAEIEALKPAFTVHLGDIVHPVPELPSYTAAANNFKKTTESLSSPLYLVPGNHDIGDKVIDWSPAGSIDNKKIDQYVKHFGPHFYSVNTNDLHLVIINAPLINSGLDAESQQQKWLENDLAQHCGARTFMFIHHPPFISEANEPHYYDNIDEPGRSWLTGLIVKYRIEALFCGHVHNFWYNRVGNADIYLLPSTAFVRQDYSEFFRVTPAAESGRNDQAKLGYVVVQVFESGHLAENIRSYGRTLKLGQTYKPISRTPSVHSRTSTVTNLGVDLRQPWAEEIQIPPSGALEEFERKLVRNDYPMQALWEMGIRLLRIPLSDFLDSRIRRRIEYLTEIGHLFQAYVYGTPNKQVRDILKFNAGILHSLEVVCHPTRIDETLHQLKSSLGIGTKLIVSRIDRKADHQSTNGRFNHIVGHGFTLHDLREMIEIQKRHPEVDGMSIRVARDACPFDAVDKATKLATETGCRPCLYMKSTTNNIAEHFIDERDNAHWVAKATLAALCTTKCDLILDTFSDIDRGYLVRSGLVDRRFNPRGSGNVVRQLLGLLVINRDRTVRTKRPNIIEIQDDTNSTQWTLSQRAKSDSYDLSAMGLGPFISNTPVANRE